MRGLLIGKSLILVAGSILLLTFIVVQVVFFPIAAVIHCIRNRDLSPASKVAWSCLILLTWTLGASIYGVIASRRPLFKTLGAISLCLVVPAVLARKPLVRYLAERQERLVLAKLDQVQLVDLTDVDRAILKTEIVDLDLSRDTHRDLVGLLVELTRRGQLDRNQLKDWQRYYLAQDTLDDALLKKHIMQLQLDYLRHR